ncbi:MAG: ABC transporter permease [Bacteroidales bacterium]
MKTFFALFFRITMRNRAFVLLNTLALAVGMAVFILIMLWVKNEFLYDKYNENYDRIVRVKVDYNLMGERDGAVASPATLARVLLEDFPEVEHVVRFRDYATEKITYDNKTYTDVDVIHADSSVFDIFSIELTRGNPEVALTRPNTITISESTARRFFGNTDPVGQLLLLNNERTYEVTGVYADIPDQSHFHFDCIASVYGFSEERENIWISFNFLTYVLLAEDADHAVFERKLDMLVDQYLAEQFEQWLGSTWEEIKEQGTWFKFSIQPLTDIHLHSNYAGDFEVNGDIRYVVIFVVTAIFILLLACINFINLSTAKALGRSHEIGVKKVFGARFHRLVLNHLGESFILVFLAHIVAMMMVELSLPLFNMLAGQQLAIDYSSPDTYLGILAIVVVTTLLAGSYPAFFLSSRSAHAALKRMPAMGTRKSRLRDFMVIGQFVISIVLLSCTLLLNKQLQYIQNKDLGFDKNQLLTIWNTDLSMQQMHTFREEVLKNPQVEQATITSFLPIPSGRDNRVLFKDGIKTTNLTSYNLMYIDDTYLETLGIDIVEGRGFSSDFAADSLAIVINRTAARAFGWEDPTGKVVGVPFGIDQIQEYKVIGVIEDFHYESVHNAIKPLVCFLQPTAGAITCRLKTTVPTQEVLTSLRSSWSNVNPGQPFQYTFFQNRLARLYDSEVKLSRILAVFTILAFFISCLGLIGLAIFTTEQRKKEIGVRKVVGASGFQVGRLLSFDLTRLVLIAFVIAAPTAYFAMTNWFESFAYATNVSLWVFVIAGLLSYLAGLLAIVYQASIAAAANPVDTLRDE